MQLDLTRYRQPLSEFARTFQPRDIGNTGNDFRVMTPVELAFDIHKDKGRFRLVGTIRTELELECGRCLEGFRLPVDSAFDLRYLPASEASTEPEREMSEDDLETSFYRDDQIDLNELISEQFYLVLPMKPLCSEGCRGLCPQCGTNLNTGTCDCAPAWEDPRLAALKGLGKSR